MKLTAKHLISFKKDFDENGKWQKKTYTIADGHGNRETIDVAMADGSSIEFLMVKTYKALLYAGRRLNWNAAAHFNNLEQVLVGKASQYYEQEVELHYPNAADKTMPNYRELCKRIITRLSPIPWPGNHEHTYLEQKIHYAYCIDPDTGEQMKPNDILLRMQQIASLGRQMHHTYGNQYMTPEMMKRAFYNIFSNDMKEWLTDVQGIDPMDPAQNYTAQQIADEFQHKWTTDQSKKKRKQREEDNNNRNNNRNGSNKRYRRGGGGNNNNNNNNNNNQGNDNCPIKGHEHNQHGWGGCFLNLTSQKCDYKAAKDFYWNKAKGGNAWYKDHFNSNKHKHQGGGSNTNNNNGGGRGYQNQRNGNSNGNRYQNQGSRGNQGGRGYQGNNGRDGRGGRGYNNQGGRGGNNNGYNNYNNNNSNGYQQQGQGNDGYHYQNDGYHYQNDGYQNEQQQAPQEHQSFHYYPREAPSAPSSSNLRNGYGNGGRF